MKELLQRGTEIALIVLLYVVVIYATGCGTVKGLCGDIKDVADYCERSIDND